MLKAVDTFMFNNRKEHWSDNTIMNSIIGLGVQPIGNISWCLWTTVKVEVVKKLGPWLDVLSESITVWNKTFNILCQSQKQYNIKGKKEFFFSN